MKKEFCPETIDKVLATRRFQQPYPTSGYQVQNRRKPLNVPFNSRSNCHSSRVLRADEIDDPTVFNAVGSRITDQESGAHLPVIDVDGGIDVKIRRRQIKLVLTAAHKGSYGSGSELRDVLGDHGIDLEVFQTPVLRHGMMENSTSFDRYQTSSIVLRSTEHGMFDVVDSSTDGHAHLYIEKEFTDYDHHTLIHELGRVGVVSNAWVGMTDMEEMSIVRTPWTEKAITHVPS